MFLEKLIASIKDNSSNDHRDNFNFRRFGEPEREVVNTQGAYEKIFPYLPRLGKFYNLLGNEESKDLLIQITAFRMLGHRKIKLPLSTPSYWEACDSIESMGDKNNSIDPDFLGFQLLYHDLSPLQIPVRVYTTLGGILYNFILKQYEYAITEEKSIKAEEGEIVIDAGGCWGDTALYFAAEVGPEGKVYTFEFIPKNLRILKKNLDTNPALQPRITVIEHPVWDRSGLPMYYIDNGPGSHVSMEELPGYSGIAESLSIDDLCARFDLARVDFIKMDIEGAEPFALQGAINTIKKFRPKLALAIYHNLDDYSGIIHFINELGLGYEFYLGHYTIHHEETVLYCDPSERPARAHAPMNAGSMQSNTRQ